MNDKRMIIKLDGFIDDISATSHSIIGSYTDENGTAQSVTLLSNTMFKEYTDSLLYDRYFPFKKREAETVEAAVVRNFENKWNVFIEENTHNFNRIAEALYSYYNPLYNYNKKLQSTNVKSGSEADSNSMIYGATSNTMTKTGNDVLQNVFGATSDTLTKSGSDILTSIKGATSETLTKSGSDILTSIKGATEKHTAESGTITDQHAFGQKVITKESTTYDSDSWFATNKDTEGQHTDTDTRSYNNHDVEETEIQHTDTDTRTFDQYQETNAGASHTDTVTHSFNNYQETNAGIQHTDTGSGSHTYNNVTDTYNENMYGNIGVMESVTMIESELRLRQKQIGLDLLMEFFNLYTYRV